MHLDSSALAHGFPLPQKCIDWNREVLKRELGLSESDIVDIPQLFFLKGAYAEAFFPDMVRVPGGWVRGQVHTEAAGSAASKRARCTSWALLMATGSWYLWDPMGSSWEGC